MAKKKEPNKTVHAGAEEQKVFGLRSMVVEQPITETLESNFMPYAMSVIVSRAIPEIDGFKPSHRKLLYCMYKMGLLTGARTKSANIVGATMRYNPHGDAAIYETMVRLSKGNEALNTPFVDSKGSFGDQQRHGHILMSELLEAAVQIALDVLPDRVAVWPQDVKALDAGVVDKLGLGAHVGEPLGKIDLHIGDLFYVLFFRHVRFLLLKQRRPFLRCGCFLILCDKTNLVKHSAENPLTSGHNIV